LSFTPCDASVSLIVRPFSQKYHFLYNRGMHILKSHKKNGFVEVLKNLARYRSENNFVEMLKLVVRMSKLFAALSCLSFLHNYFDSFYKTKLFSN